MTTDSAGRLVIYEELLRRFASGIRAAQLYAPDHPLLARNVDGLLGALKSLHQHQPAVTGPRVSTKFFIDRQLWHQGAHSSTTSNCCAARAARMAASGASSYQGKP